MLSAVSALVTQYCYRRVWYLFAPCETRALSLTWSSHRPKWCKSYIASQQCTYMLSLSVVYYMSCMKLRNKVFDKNCWTDHLEVTIKKWQPLSISTTLFQWHLVNLDTFASDYQEKNSNCKVSHYFWWWSMAPNAQWLAMTAVKTKIIDEFRERLLKVRGNLVFRFMGRLGFLC
jgi:hypothetical protein